LLAADQVAAHRHEPGATLGPKRRSRVRYRAVEVLRGTPALVAARKEDLSWIAGHDENRDVRVIAGKALARAD
jgi:hypothetical protein